MNQSIAVNDSLIQRVNVGDLLTRSAARYPTKEAVIDGSRRFTYREFETYANRIAHGLLELGYQRGDAIALISGNSADFLATYFACGKIGVICTPINLFWRGRELAYVLKHANIRAVVVEGELLEQLVGGFEEGQQIKHVIVVGGVANGMKILPESIKSLSLEALVSGKSDKVPNVLVNDRDPVSYLYTSGTTATPKGVVSSHLAVYLAALGIAIDTRMTSDDKALAMMPMFHTAQLNAVCMTVFAVSGSICVMKKFDAEALLDLIEKEKLTFIFALPMMYRLLTEAQKNRKRDVSSLRLAGYAMAPMSDNDLRAAIEEFACGFCLVFGQTEMNPEATFFRPEHQLSHSGAVGTPGLNVQIGIMDDKGELLPPGEAGEIVYRSPQTFSGYLHDPEATREAFQHGWFHSGDAGYFGKDGMLWFTDRFKDVIKSGGENIASVEVEKALMEVEPKIAEVVVIGLPHQRWIETVTAVIVPREGEKIDQNVLLAKLRERISPYKCPKSIIIADALPKTSTGKIQKAVLRKNYANFYEQEGGN